MVFLNMAFWMKIKNIRKILYENLNFIKNKYIDFEILPQTMPPFLWHQGGTAYHNLIRSSNDIEDLYLKTKLNVCLTFLIVSWSRLFRFLL